MALFLLPDLNLKKATFGFESSVTRVHRFGTQYGITLEEELYTQNHLSTQRQRNGSVLRPTIGQGKLDILN